MKRIIASLLILATLLSVLGCTKNSENVITDFLDLMQSGQYGEAYELLSSSCRNDSSEERSSRISKEEFINKHTAIFDVLAISSVTYSNISVQSGEMLMTATYTATYHSDETENFTNDFSVAAVLENGEWHIEWSPALIFPEMRWGDTVRVAKLSAKRGEIISDGEALATTAGTISVYASPSKIENEALFFSSVSRLLDMNEDQIRKCLDKVYNDVAVLKEFYSDELTPSMSEALLKIDGIGIDHGNYGTHREYPHDDMLAHIVGYVGPLTAPTTQELEAKIAELNEGRSELDGLYNPDSIVGKTGLELQYEKELRGKDGRMIYICTKEGTNRKTLFTEPSENGLDIELTIDMKLQSRLEEVMHLVLFGETTAGAVVVMNPKTGEIQAMCSYPSYDLNAFARGMSSTEYSKLTEDAAKPLFNRITQGLYPPGSVFKAFVAASLLDTNTLSTGHVFEGDIDDDYWTPKGYGTWIWPAIKRSEMNVRAEPLNMHNAIINSDNIYFADAALRLGEDKLFPYLRNLGFEEAIDFDISVAQPQLLNENTELTLKLLADSGYGQGEILVTPLQLAATFSAFANGGDIAVPRIVKGTRRTSGILSDVVSTTEKRIWRENVISDYAISAIRPMLEHVVSRDYNGTGHQLKVSSCTVAAKTGTAEIGSDKSREISWFAGFRTDVDAKDERLVLVMLEVPATSQYSSLKFDIARELLKMSAE